MTVSRCFCSCIKRSLWVFHTVCGYITLLLYLFHTVALAVPHCRCSCIPVSHDRVAVCAVAVSHCRCWCSVWLLLHSTVAVSVSQCNCCCHMLPQCLVTVAVYLLLLYFAITVDLTDYRCCGIAMYCRLCRCAVSQCHWFCIYSLWEVGASATVLASRNLGVSTRIRCTELESLLFIS